MPDAVRRVMQAGSPISWGAIITAVLAMLTATFQYGHLTSRVEAVEAISPLARENAVKLARIEEQLKAVNTNLDEIKRAIWFARPERTGGPR